MEDHDSARITEHFKALHDPRILLKTQHKLVGISLKGYASNINSNQTPSRSMISKEAFFPGHFDAAAKRRLSARATHRFRILRAHGIIQKVQSSHRFLLTSKGRQIVSAIIPTRCIPVSRITELAA